MIFANFRKNFSTFTYVIFLSGKFKKAFSCKHYLLCKKFPRRFSVNHTQAYYVHRICFNNRGSSLLKVHFYLFLIDYNLKVVFTYWECIYIIIHVLVSRRLHFLLYLYICVNHTCLYSYFDRVGIYFK